MLRGEPVSLDRERYQVSDAVNSPAPLSKIPIMVGGAGEKKTLRMVAQYADESNLVGTAAATSRANWRRSTSTASGWAATDPRST